MLNLDEFHCTGCSACYNACANGAIEMLENSEGFKYPKIDQNKCTNCGLCEKVCVAKNGYKKTPFMPVAFGLKNKNLEERRKSQSGGAFYLVAKHVLSKGGVVYGAFIDESFFVRHGRACNEEEAKTFRGSKYVQSDLGDIFKRVKEDLQSGVEVLFSGTPCQVAGLKAFLRKNYENLLTVDLICHGVPSPMVWRDYINWQKERVRKPIQEINFRDKSYCWGTHYESIVVGRKKKKFDIYTTIFYQHNSHRESCYHCQFTNLQRVSDITVGDYWGIEEVNVGFRDDDGVSAVIVNSEKGLSVWDSIKNKADFFESRVESMLPRNPHLQKPVDRPVSREEFWRDYKKGFNFISKKYGKWTVKNRIKEVVKKYGGQTLVNAIKKVMKKE